MHKACRDVRLGGTYQGSCSLYGIARETVSSQAICTHLLRDRPGGRARAVQHASPEITIYVISGTAELWWGDRLQQRMERVAGDLIDADVPHPPVNRGTDEAVAVIARTDPHEQESVILLPDLETLMAV